MRTPKLSSLLVLLLAPGAAFAQDDAAPEPAAAPAEEAKPAGGSTPGLSLPPSAPTVGDSLVPTTAAEMGLGGGEGASDDWHFEFHGYMRAPVRLGIGKNINRAPGQSNLQFHSPPMVPDWNYITWQYTNNIPSPWTELNFQYGQSRVKMTAQIAAYNITDGGYRQVVSQLGINQVYLTLNFPDAIPNGGLTWNVGVFSNRYGWAGRYDAGKYDTYLIGRTHIAGETLAASYDVNGELQLQVEHGLGANLETMPFMPTFDNNILNNSNPQYLPYAGPYPQGTTLLHHMHLGVAWKKMIIAGLHYMTAWNQDSMRVAGYAAPQPWGGAVADAARPDGSMTVLGFDLKFLGGAFGDGYFGFAHTSAKNVNSIAENSIEQIHSFGGWQMSQNYFNPMPRTSNDNTTFYDSGKINTVLFQYVFSFGQLFRYPKQFWGDGPDLIASVFGMYNQISGVSNWTTPGVNPQDCPGGSTCVAKQKLKFGMDVTYLPLPFIGGGARFDMVQPNLADANQSFSVFSPFLIFKTQFVTHEQIVLKYSHYFYKNESEQNLTWPYYIPEIRSKGGNPANGTIGPDKDVISLSAQMWW